MSKTENIYLNFKVNLVKVSMVLTAIISTTTQVCIMYDPALQAVAYPEANLGAAARSKRKFHLKSQIN